MSHFQATLSDDTGATQTTILQAEDAEDAQRILAERGHNASSIQQVIRPVQANFNQAPEGDATGGLIPYKNPFALTAYYLGLFSLFPVVGLALAIPAFVFGIMGLRKRKLQPEIKGAVHAWIGIVMGGLMTLVWGAVTVLIVATVIFAQNTP